MALFRRETLIRRMIFVERQIEPGEFDERVRQPGKNYLETNPNPTSCEFSNHSYWRKISGKLHSGYDGICAYTCHRIWRDTGWGTVEHFVPKSVHPQLAYEWSNYRLVCGRLNGRKGKHQDVIDPFLINEVMFVIDFPSLLIKPYDQLSDDRTQQVHDSIHRLKLNENETNVSARQTYVEEYCREDISFDFLRRNAPFLYREITRQGIETDIREIMGIYPAI